MNIATITGIVVALTLLIGAVLAWLFKSLSAAVESGYQEAEKEKTALNLATTRGFKIPVNEDLGTQLAAARQEAARRAAMLPRGANMRISGNGIKPGQTAFKGVDSDPITAVKIAAFHGWQGVAHGIPSGQGIAQAPAKARTTTPKKSPKDLEPGIDYPEIEITEAMSPDEVRRARIQNSKAKAAAIKALKQAGSATEEEAAVESGTAPKRRAEVAPAQAQVTAAGEIREPVAGVDYEEIAVTDDMSPADIRKARIANAKARSAAAKALKAAGATVVAAPVVAAAPAPEPEPEVSSAAAPANMPPTPDYIEITEAMSPAEIRRARIENAKMKSAFNKELKAMGIDPSSL